MREAFGVFGEEEGDRVIKFEPRIKSEISDAHEIEQIVQATGLSVGVAQILWQRDIKTVADAERFLRPSEEHIHDPFLLPDMAQGVERIKRAVAEGEIVTVFCDYDADGTCGGSALYLYLQSKDVNVNIMSPNRHKEGYGLNEGAVREIDANDSTLIITVDCGITNVDEIEVAKSLGIDVIITDHHECGQTLPDTPYIINPKRPGSEYPCAFIAGCGVAFKLIHALSNLETAMQYIDLIAIGTVTDIVPLLDENRAIVHLGVQRMKENPSAGVEALARAAGIKIGTSLGVSFGLGPRINAAGRMDTADIAIEILSATQSSKQLDEKAKALCALNDLRRAEVDKITSSAQKMVMENEYMNDSAILLANEEWNTGVIGIAAAKITDKFTRPCVLFGGADGLLVGSARSIDSINIYEALDAFSDTYEKFGGHAQAAGLTIKPGQLGSLRENVCKYIDTHYDESAFVQSKVYDMQLRVSEITSKLVADIDRLEPFGHANEKPVVAVMGADITQTKYVGKGIKPHLKFGMRQDGAVVDAVSFFFKSNHSFVSRTCDFLGEAGINDFNSKPQIVVRHMSMHFDNRLVDSFVAAHKNQMYRQFMDEVAQVYENSSSDMGESDFMQSVDRQMDKSRFGMCIVAGTKPAFDRLLGIDVIKKALSSGTLILYDSRDYKSDNCVACAPVSGHRIVYRVGVPGFYDARMQSDYKKHAQVFFAPRNELLGVYKTMLQFAADGSKTMEQISQSCGITYEKAAFAMRVFYELQLIEVEKSGRIFATKNGGEKKELSESLCYRSFVALMEEGK